MKRVMVGVIAAVLITLICILIFGLMNPFVTYENKVEINEPRDVVWKYFNDTDKMGEWLKGFKKIETISGKPNGVGSKYKLYFVDQGNEIVMYETVTAFKDKEFISFRLDHEILSSDVEIRITESNGRTVIHQKVHSVGSNIFWRTIFAFTVSDFEENAQESLDKLKSNVEKL